MFSKIYERIVSIFEIDMGIIMCNICLIIVLCLVGYHTYGSLIFKIRHLHPVVTERTDKVINTDNEPIQIDMNKFQGKSIIGDRGNKYFLEYKAKYSISGMVVATNTNFWLRGTMRNNFDEVALYDIGLVWGRMVDVNLLKRYDIRFKSVKTMGFARQLSWRVQKYDTSFPVTINYMNSHISHTHVIPRNDNIMSALYKIKKYDKVRMNGYLVDIYDNNSRRFALTSLSRSDTNQSSRGHNNDGGACEVMYVTALQLGDEIYK